MSDSETTKPFAIESVPWEEWSEGTKFGSRLRRLGKFGGASHVGVVMEELAPGMQSSPLHYHMLEEEHLMMLAGRATLRLGDQRYALSAGDYVVFPAGQKAGHALVNDSDEVCRFLMIGERNPNEVCVYPDSNKVLVCLTDELYDKSAVRNYWAGEDTGA
ncbi:MAG TPA: cupin domain-containing protein [Aliidongia sp.]|nr:cupin domain-containing protein [Aliidongia sp.]